MAARLQVALDVLDLDRAVALVEAVEPWADEIEVGSQLLIKEGVAAIQAVRRAAPECVLVADTKISDSGDAIARICFDAGANAVTVLAQTSQTTLAEVRAVADRAQGRIWLDLIGTENPVVRATVMAPLVDGFVAYRPLSGLPRIVVNNLLALDRPVRLAGGLNLAALDRLRGLALDGIIVGSAILQADDPSAMAQALHEALQDFR